MTRPAETPGLPVDLGGVLHVTRAGSAVVSTDELLASADRLRGLERRLAEFQHRVVAAQAVGLGGAIDSGLVPVIDAVRDRCERARDAYARVAEDYTRAEARIEGFQRNAAAFLAATAGPALVGFLARLVLLQPGVLIAGALAGWAALPDGPDGRLGSVRDYLLAHPEFVTSPGFTRFVSLVATSLDDGVLGLAGVPPWLAVLPGVDVARGGDQGVAAGALTTIALGRMLGMFRETPVTVERTGTQPAAPPPSGIRGTLDRIPEGSPVRIERYQADGRPDRYVVYVGPTETFSPVSADEPRDLTSNVHGVAGLSAGAFRVVEAAMADAGIRPGDEVMVAGFSQGGLVATEIAASRDWNVVGLVSFGAPAGNIPLPDGMFGMAVRNTDDFVPALAGPQLDHHLLQIEREAFAGDTPPPTEFAAPAHQRSGYAHTADAVDAAESAVVREQVRAVGAFTADYLELPGGRATEYLYQGRRE